MSVATLALVLAVSSGAAVPWGTGASKGEDLVVTLVTFGPGDDMTEWFGHSALVVSDRRLHEERLYNYGEFDFDSTVIVRYALGHLTFHVGERGVQSTYAAYRERNRSIHLQELALTVDERVQIAQALALNALPENRDYQYDHYLDNCATRPRDMIDRAVGGRLRATTKPARMTLRGHTRRMTSVMPVMSVLIDFIENASVDRPITTWDEAFLPQELADQVRAAGLVANERDLFTPVKRAPIPAVPPAYWTALLVLGLVVAAAALVARKRRKWAAAHALFASLVLGVPGTVSFLMWLITVHAVAHHSENLFLANPITLLAVIPSSLVLLGKPARAESAERALGLQWALLCALAVVGTLLHAAGALAQDTWPTTALALPILAAEAFVFSRRRRSR